LRFVAEKLAQGDKNLQDRYDVLKKGEPVKEEEEVVLTKDEKEVLKDLFGDFYQREFQIQDAETKNKRKLDWLWINENQLKTREATDPSRGLVFSQGNLLQHACFAIVIYWMLNIKNGGILTLNDDKMMNEAGNTTLLNSTLPGEAEMLRCIRWTEDATEISEFKAATSLPGQQKNVGHFNETTITCFTPEDGTE
jgi:hypothetical protein